MQVCTKKNRLCKAGKQKRRRPDHIGTPQNMKTGGKDKKSFRLSCGATGQNRTDNLRITNALLYH